MVDLVRIQVLMPKAEADWFNAHCREKGYKKSPLIARLVREYLEREALNMQQELFSRNQPVSKDQ